MKQNSLKIRVDVDVLRVVHESHVVSTGDGCEAAPAVELHLGRVIPEPPPLPLIGHQDARRHSLMLQLEDLRTQNTANRNQFSSPTRAK